MRKYTEKGRVVYNRKKHEFNIKDVIRIGKKADLQFFGISKNNAYEFFSKLEQWIANESGVFVVPIEFGGGSFGGGGATREFAAGFTIHKHGKGIAIIIED